MHSLGLTEGGNTETKNKATTKLEQSLTVVLKEWALGERYGRRRGNVNTRGSEGAGEGKVRTWRSGNEQRALSEEFCNSRHC